MDTSRVRERFGWTPAISLMNVLDEIVSDLSNQYVLSYSSTNLQHDQKWRKIKVRVRKGDYTIRARERYQFTPTRPAGR